MPKANTERGRPRYGDAKKQPVIKFSTSLPPDIFERLEKYCQNEERDRSFPIKKALDVWLKERGY